jgi:hypothetical protein
MGNISDTNCRKNKITHFIFGNIFLKSVAFMRKCGKFGTTRQATIK